MPLSDPSHPRLIAGGAPSAKRVGRDERNEVERRSEGTLDSGWNQIKMSLEEAKQAVVDDFAMFDEWLDKYEYIISLGKNLEAFPEEKKTEDRLISGCQSRVWLDCEAKDGKLFFTADSDAIITKGIISLLISVYSGRTAEEIANDDFGFVNEIGLSENLSPTRANGLSSMIATIKQKAHDYDGK